MNRNQCKKYAALALNGATLASDDAGSDKPRTWSYYRARFEAWYADQAEAALPFSVFRLNGNSKLAFAAFSTLPGNTCPGAGDCLDWCYSYRAWRYPAAYFRQLQNTVLMRSEAGRARIASEWRQIGQNGQNRTVRLYVDGDFSSVTGLEFWMDLCHERKDLQIYGYSKSWSEFLMLDKLGYTWPSNYMLNLSSGSRHDESVRNAMMKLPVVRGDFVAVEVDREHIRSGAYRGKDREGSGEYRKAVRAALGGGKVFACPGSCRDCMPKGEHACGSPRMQGTPIGIGVHA